MTPLKSLLDLWSRIAYTFPQTSPKSISKAQHLASFDTIQFLTKFLPAMGKHLDQSLTSARLLPLSGLTKTYKGTSYPVFLREYYIRIFDADGWLRDDFDGTSLQQLRTLLYMFYKFELPFTEQQELEAMEKFIVTDDLVKNDFTEEDISAIAHTFNSLLPDNPMDIRGRHSNGATADGFSNIEKRNTFRLIPSLNDVYGVNYFFNNASHFSWFVSENDITIHEPTSRVAFVPKDSRGPRTICMEPHERMYVQQGLMHKIYEHIELFSNARGRVNFTNQGKNQYLAYRSSIDRSYATLDLKDASDMVSWSLILSVVRDEYKAPLKALRTPLATLPDGRVVCLKKFAPMGSALCFPIEAILFYSIAKTITDDVHVYGDDIIVPIECAQGVIDALEHYGLVVNRSKSLVDGYFRESCGFDSFMGWDITPLRCRNVDLISVVAFANNLSSKFGTNTGRAVIEWFESIDSHVIPRLPYSYKDTGAICFYVSERSNEILFKRRWNKNLQCYEYRMLIATVMSRKLADDSYGVLYDFYVNTYEFNSPIEDVKYLISTSSPLDYLRSGNSRISTVKTRVKYGWVTERL